MVKGANFADMLSKETKSAKVLGGARSLGMWKTSMCMLWKWLFRIILMV